MKYYILTDRLLVNRLFRMFRNTEYTKKQENKEELDAFASYACLLVLPCLTGGVIVGFIVVKAHGYPTHGAGKKRAMNN